MPAPRFLHRMPAHVINGIGVALGIALLQLLVGALGGTAAALTAASAAICASLADVPNALGRTWRRVLAAGAIGVSVSAMIGLLRPFPMAIGVATGLLGFLGGLMLAWGPRAGPVSFAGILALVFTLAAPPASGFGPLLAHAGWGLFGTALYIAWSVASSALLQPRYRTLALAAAVAATAHLLRARAALVAEDPRRAGGVPPLQAWVRDEVALAERLQAARDLLFDAPPDEQAQRQTALLLLVIDLRDTLVASQLDIDLLGHDAAGAHVRSALTASLDDMAATLDRMQEALRLGEPLPAADERDDMLRALLGSSRFADGDSRARLLPALIDRGRHMRDDLAQMQALMRGARPEVPLERAELQLFVSPEGWPLAVLRRQLHFNSPVLRHAVRNALALAGAYFLALALPWASHPYWLVLSVAVVLRGNLEQTLARRNARVAGTAVGCVIVLGLAQLHVDWLSAAVFLVAVGVAHAFITARYQVTAAAATVMALLQAHLAHPLGAFAVPERLADTLLGALLAWGFSYVLPSWERRGVAGTAARVVQTLAALARQTLRWPEGPASQLALRLARREVYDALAGLGSTAQRTRVEPESVQVPLYALATLLAHSHVLLAHLAAVKLMLARRAHELDRPEAEAALQAAGAELERRLATRSAVQADTPPAEAEEPDVPAQPAALTLMPWLRRRLQLATQAARRVSDAATALEAATGP